MPRLSAVIITLNEAHNLPRLLRSLEGVAEEVIVVDSRSADETVAIAKKAGARVISETFQGYGPQKALGIDAATGDWILLVDADEALSEELRESILQQLTQPSADAFYLTRLTNYCGAWIRHGGWYPDRVLRLWKRGMAVQNSEPVHERIEAVPGAKTAVLTGDLLHYSFPDLATHFRKIAHYADTGARHDFARGRRVSLLKLLFGPAWVFVQMYFLKLGLLDGYYGYIIARNSAFAALAKYAAIRQLHAAARR